MMPYGVSPSEAQPADQHQPKDETELPARAECHLALASRLLRFRFFLFVEISGHKIARSL
jgi:hypothetical protein